MQVRFLSKLAVDLLLACAPKGHQCLPSLLQPSVMISLTCCSAVVLREQFADSLA